MTFCYEGGDEDELNQVFKEATDHDAQNQIFEAKDSEGHLPFQKAAKHGNPIALDWIINKWEEN